MLVSRQGNRLEVSATFPEVFTKRLRKNLSRGNKIQILMEVNLHDGKKTVAQSEVRHTIRYDLWDERFFVRIEGFSGRRVRQLRTMEELVHTCGEIDKLPLVSLVPLREDRRYQVKARITVNPPTKELLRKFQDWLKPPPGKRTRGSVFGGSVSPTLMADAVYSYRSQKFTPPDEP
jgi:hypothetical protein